MSKPYIKAWVEKGRIEKERRSASAKHARAALRTPTRGPQREKDNAEIAAFLARVPPRLY